MTNPLAYIETRQGNFGWSDNIVGNMYAEIEPIKGLKVRSDFGAKLAFYGSESFSPVAYLNASTYVANNSYYRESNKGFIWNWENTASYTRSFGKHNGTILIGTSAYVDNYQGINATYRNLPVDNFYDASMNYSLPANPAIVDYDNDGFIDTGYCWRPWRKHVAVQILPSHWGLAPHRGLAQHTKRYSLK